MPRQDITPQYDDEIELQDALMAFVRSFGLLATHETPCGQPMPISQAHALTELAQRSLTQLQLGEALGLRKSTVSRLVDQLVDHRWAVRMSDANDARCSVVTLTASGRKRAKDISIARAQRFGELLNRIAPTDRTHVTTAIRLLAKAAHAN